MNKAIFLDRDGVININTHYVNKIEDFKIYPFVSDALKLFKQAGYKIFVVTNQAGIEKGFVDEEELQNIHRYMKLHLPEIDDIRYCPSYNSFDRKPNPGMILDLAYEYEIFTADSWMIGDMFTDIQAGRNAGCWTCLVMSSITESLKYSTHDDVNVCADNLLEAAKIILGKEGYIQ